MEKTEMMKSKGGIAKFQEMPKDWENNPKILRKIIENLSEKIDELQAKANISDEAVETFQEIIRNQCDEISALKEKAEAYDRLMSGGLTMKELANILKHPVAIENDDNQNTLYYFNSTPYIGQFSDGTQFWSCKRKRRLPRQLVNFYGDWKDSLTLPDGWEEKKQ